MRATASVLLILILLAIPPTLSGCGPVSAMAGGASEPAHNAIVVGPVLQRATPDSVSVMWETLEGIESVVEYGTTPNLGTFATGQLIYGPTGRMIHHADMTPLVPDTQYFYRVVGPDAPAQINTFHTPPAPGSRKSFKFAVYSDCQQQPRTHRQIVDQGIYASVAHDGDIGDELGFVLVAGDIVQNGNNYGQYRERFFEPIQNISGSVPYYAAIGNHEENSHYYFDYLNLPQNGTPGYEEHWYSFDYANTHVIGLDTNGAYSIAEQLTWLEQDLATACQDPNIDMIFAFFHHPFKSELWVPGEHAYSGQLVSALERQLSACDKVGAYFFGHTHGYSRGQSKDANLYWVNVGSAGGDLDHWGEYPQRDYPEFQKSFDEYGVLMVEVNPNGQVGFAGERLSFGDEAIARRGEVQDYFAVTTSNQPPSQPELTSAQVSGHQVTVNATAFADNDSTLHLEAEWQVADSETFEHVLNSSWQRYENWFKDVDTNAGLNLTRATFDVRDGTNQALWTRVRYRDDKLAWSSWSTPLQVRP